ncbi:MAG: DNA-directed RNA polymerase, partial [Candidatus Woesearchaeota archaeon]
MFYKIKISDYIRVSPDKFGLGLDDAIIAMIKKKYEGYISKELGIVIDVFQLSDIGEGVLVPGDGAPYYQVQFELIVFRPELQEIIIGRLKDIADFGAFISIGPADGMIHISQTMNDFVSFGKDKVLLGKESRRNLKVGDMCRARIIAVSYKDLSNLKVGLTMRQEGLGKLEWLEEDLNPKQEQKTAEKKAT